MKKILRKNMLIYTKINEKLKTGKRDNNEKYLTAKEERKKRGVSLLKNN